MKLLLCNSCIFMDLSNTIKTPIKITPYPSKASRKISLILNGGEAYFLDDEKNSLLANVRSLVNKTSQNVAGCTLLLARYVFIPLH